MQVFLSIETKRFEIEFFKNPQLGICEKTDFTSKNINGIDRNQGGKWPESWFHNNETAVSVDVDLTLVEIEILGDFDLEIGHL